MSLSLHFRKSWAGPTFRLFFPQAQNIYKGMSHQRSLLLNTKPTQFSHLYAMYTRPYAHLINQTIASPTRLSSYYY